MSLYSIIMYMCMFITIMPNFQVQLLYVWRLHHAECAAILIWQYIQSPPPPRSIVKNKWNVLNWQTTEAKLSRFYAPKFSWIISILIYWRIVNFIYTNTRFLSLRDEPVVPMGGYMIHQIKMAITAHWHWMQDSFKVSLHATVLN